MRKTLTTTIATLTLTLAASFAMAATQGKLTGITIDPASPAPKQPFHLTVQGTNPVGVTCTMDILKPGIPWSRLGTTPSFPYQASNDFFTSGWMSFDNPGTYVITVKGAHTADSDCAGEVTLQVHVNAPAPPMVLSANPNMGISVSPCPQGWHGTAQPSGAVSCHPNKPATKLTCPAKTQYYENDCEFGCQQIIY